MKCRHCRRLKGCHEMCTFFALFLFNPFHSNVKHNLLRQNRRVTRTYFVGIFSHNRNAGTLCPCCI